MKKLRTGEWTALAIFVMGLAGWQATKADAPVAALAPAPAAPRLPTMARDAFAKLRTVIEGAQSVQYVSTIKTIVPGADHKTLEPVTLDVKGTVQQPDGFRIEISRAGAPKYILASGTTTGYVVDVPAKKYATFEKPDSLTGFQFGVQTAGRGLLDDSAGSVFIILDPLNDPKQFDISAGAPPGTFTTVAQQSVFGGKHLTKIVQSAQVEPGRKLTFRLYLDTATGLPSHVELEEDTNGKDVIGYQEDYASWTIGSAPLDASTFDYTPSATETAYVAPPDPQMTPLLANGTQAPDFTATTIDGKSVKLSDYAGKVVVLDFWATWCNPCQMELPIVSRLSDDYAPKGVVFLAVCSWDQNALFTDWVKAHSPWTNMTFAFDPAGVNGEQSIATKLYDVSGIPAQFIIGKDGKVMASVDYYDPSDRHDRKLIEKALTQ